MASKKMTVRDAYAKSKKQGSKVQPQNPSGRNKVGEKAKSKNKPGPWDDIARGVVKGAKIAGKVGRELAKPAVNPIGAAKDTVKTVARDVKNKNVGGLLLQAAAAVPAGKAGKAGKAVSQAANAAKKGGKAASAAKKATAAKSALQQAQDELASINRQMQAFKGPKANGRQASTGWANLLRKRQNAQRKVNNALQSEQKSGKAAENMRKIGKEEPTRVDLSEGQTVTSNKDIKAPAKPRAYSRVGRATRDRGGNAPLEKNQRYAYEADDMKRIEGKERFERREQRRMEKSTKNKERQAIRDESSKLNRNQEKYDKIKEQAKTGGPKAKQRLARYESWAKEAGVWGKLKK